MLPSVRWQVTLCDPIRRGVFGILLARGLGNGDEHRSHRSQSSERERESAVDYRRFLVLLLYCYYKTTKIII